jgi:glycerol-1-phosphate dehydrogenase [NAD(P)+]
MIFSQLTHLPIIFQVDEDIFARVGHLLERNKLSFNNILVVSGGSISYDLSIDLIRKYKWDSFVLSNNDFSEIEKLKAYCLHKKHDLIIAVGGGKVLDSVKRVCYLINLNHISLPTIISNDGLISPIAVIKNERGKTESLPGSMPMGVIIDLDIIQKTPIKYLRAAAGDILSNLSATHDWILSYNKNGEYVNDLAFQLSRSAANSLVHFNEKDLHYKPFLRQIIQGQVNSGIAMSLSGSSRPCSGSEHLISHAIDYLEVGNGSLHGIQVASISLFILFLQDKLLPEYIDYAKSTGIPLLFTELLNSTENRALIEIFRKSKEMRPGRYTILDTITEVEFIDNFTAFKNEINYLVR